VQSRALGLKKGLGDREGERQGNEMNENIGEAGSATVVGESWGLYSSEAATVT
jgi:hypothetical protein